MSVRIEVFGKEIFPHGKMLWFIARMATLALLWISGRKFSILAYYRLLIKMYQRSDENAFPKNVAEICERYQVSRQETFAGLLMKSWMKGRQRVASCSSGISFGRIGEPLKEINIKSTNLFD